MPFSHANRACTGCRCPVTPGGGTGPTVSVLSFVGRVPSRGAGFAATDNCGMHRHAKAGGAHLDTPTIVEVAPLPARHERGEGWGEGLVPSNRRGLLKSPLPDPPHFSVVGRGNSGRPGGSVKMRPLEK